MCDPVTATMAALSAGQAALQIQSVNQSIASQGEHLNRQVGASYQQAAYERNQQARGAVDEAYRSEIAKRQAVGAAIARNAALGIRGTTAAEVVGEEQQVGNYNVASAMSERRNADAAYTLGTTQTHDAAVGQANALRAQAPTMFETLLTIGASGLQGYLIGHDVKDAFSTDPTNLPAGTT